MPVPAPWTLAPAAAGTTLAAAVKDASGEPWSVVKKWIAGGKVLVGGTAVTAIDHRVRGGEAVEVRLAAPKPRDPMREGELVFDDAHLVVIDKPSGVSSVPYDDRETGTAMDLIRGAWRRMGRRATETPLHVVHRIDKATSGLLVFAKSKRSEIGLAAQFRDHSCEREYRCVAHGDVRPQTIESYLLADRGDGIRGSTRHANQGKHAVTHVAVLERVRGATVCAIRLETGKTHQIRIHLAEAGHPLVGEEVYVREYQLPFLAAPRLLLHAATLGFLHPVTGARMQFASPVPDEMTRWIAARR